MEHFFAVGQDMRCHFRWVKGNLPQLFQRNPAIIKVKSLAVQLIVTMKLTVQGNLALTTT